MSRRYTADGWVDAKRIYDNGRPWNILIGARQIGKTFGFVKELMHRDDFFLFVRRTEDELLAIQDPKLDPFGKVNDWIKAHENPAWLDWKMFQINKHVWEICPAEYDSDKGSWVRAGEVVGMAVALSTYSKVRGFASDTINTILYDEFIPESHVHRIKREGWAIMNMYESINSNRELQGRPAVKIICMANANQIANPLMMQLGLVEKADKLEQTGGHVYATRDLYYCNFSDSPISAKKADTVLYRINEGNDFARMALNSSFSGDERGWVDSRDLRKYKPLVIVGEIEIYEHKNNPELYVSMHKSGSPARYPRGDISFRRFRRSYPGVLDYYMANRIVFETYTCELYLREVLGLSA